MGPHGASLPRAVNQGKTTKNHEKPHRSEKFVWDPAGPAYQGLQTRGNPRTPVALGQEWEQGSETTNIASESAGVVSNVENAVEEVDVV